MQIFMGRIAYSGSYRRMVNIFNFETSYLTPKRKKYLLLSNNFADLGAVAYGEIPQATVCD